MATLFKSILFLALCVGLHFFCDYQTAGFRLYEIQSNRVATLPSPPLSLEEKQKVHALLNQSFSYLGSGQVSHAFLGEDKKTVLKFFKHSDAYPENILRNIYVPKFLEPLRQKIVGRRGIDLDVTYQCCQLALDELPEYSGVIHLHLQKTEGEYGTVVIKDKIGVVQHVNLDATEFVIQKKGELILDHLSAQIKAGRIEEAKLSISSLFDFIKFYCEKGIQIPHPALERNFGYIDNQAITIDIGSFNKNDSFKSFTHYQTELFAVTHHLRRWLLKRNPELHRFYVEELSRRLTSESEFSP